MSKRLMAVFGPTEAVNRLGIRAVRSAKVYKDAEQGEFVVKFYVGGHLATGADYYTEDWYDARSTAENFSNGDTL